jgi:ATP-binding cassette subfamily C protein/ATP-binding cassette subfamily C exporter for protease/lipase/ATP-binding cassette subfamily C protein EexD
MTRSNSDNFGPRRTQLSQAISDCRKAALIAGAFSTVINLLILTPSLYMMQIYDRVLTTGHMETMVFLTGIAGVALLVLAALDSLRSAVMVRVGCWLNDRLGPVFLANSIVANLQGDTAGAQPLRDLAQIQNFVSTQGLTVFFDSPWLVVFVALIWLLHPLLGVIALATALLLLLLSIVNELMTRKASLKASLAQIAAMKQAEAAIRNAEVVQAMGMLPAIISRWQAANGDSMAATSTAAERGGIIVGITKFIRFFAQVTILAAGAYLVVRSNVTPGSMIAASILMGRALAPVELALAAWRNFSTTRIAYARLKARLNNFSAEFDRIQLPPPKGNLAVEELFYRSRAGVILRSVSFEATPGESVAIIGPSASGKSTLCRLIVGVLPATAGQIRLDGSEIMHWDPEQLGRYIGYLPQDVELFAGSVKENIARMGPVDDVAVVSAAILAQAHDMIKHLSEGYDTQIGDGGLRLSGGQRQRIGLARALYGDPRLVVLDEPNANLDQPGEAALSTAIHSLKRRNVSLIIVGHRPSTLATADKILLLREGRVEVFGPRDVALQKIRAAQPSAAGAVVPMQKPAAVASMAAMSEVPQGHLDLPHTNGGG